MCTRPTVAPALVGYVAYSPAPTPHRMVHPQQPREKARNDILGTSCYVATGSSHLHGLHRRSVFAIIDQNFNAEKSDDSYSDLTTYPC
jgi:hypothetical protein